MTNGKWNSSSSGCHSPAAQWRRRLDSTGKFETFGQLRARRSCAGGDEFLSFDGLFVARRSAFVSRVGEIAWRDFFAARETGDAAGADQNGFAGCAGKVLLILGDGHPKTAKEEQALMKKLYMQSVLKQSGTEQKLVQLGGLGGRKEEGTGAVAVSGD